MNKAKSIRSDIMEIIFKVDDIQLLKSMFQEVEKTLQTSIVKPLPSFMQAVKPIRTNVTLDQIKAEQNFKPVSYQTFRKKANEIEWEQDLEELLGALTK